MITLMSQHRERLALNHIWSGSSLVLALIWPGSSLGLALVWSVSSLGLAKVRQMRVRFPLGDISAVLLRSVRQTHTHTQLTPYTGSDPAVWAVAGKHCV